ncbi:MAG: hypothetical protein ACJAWV_003499 [Flammeovirgaceae bacterium]|jgi:hypothetical protein
MNNEIARIIIVLLGGIWGIYQAYSSHFESSFFDFFELILSVIIISPIWIWSFYEYSVAKNRSQKRQNGIAILVGGILLSITITIYSFTNYQFNKPTLVKVLYDGGYNGIAIDFKTDGTFITNDSAMFGSIYSYGEYSIENNKIVLIGGELSSFFHSNRLLITEFAVGIGDSRKRVYQVDDTETKIPNSTEFKLTVDNR